MFEGLCLCLNLGLVFGLSLRFGVGFLFEI